MAAVESRKIEKGEGGGLAGGLSWGPRKLGELKSFFSEVRTELKKVTWPSKTEVYATTLVVIVTTVFFGFYLYAVDLGLTQIFTRLLRQ